MDNPATAPNLFAARPPVLRGVKAFAPGTIRHTRLLIADIDKTVGISAAAVPAICQPADFHNPINCSSTASPKQENHRHHPVVIPATPGKSAQNNVAHTSPAADNPISPAAAPPTRRAAQRRLLILRGLSEASLKMNHRLGNPFQISWLTDSPGPHSPAPPANPVTAAAFRSGKLLPAPDEEISQHQRAFLQQGDTRIVCGRDLIRW